jgi:hypothetical protein
LPEEITAGTIKITAGAEEKVGLANYSNVVIGPIIISRLVEDGDDEHVKEQIKRNLRLVEDVIAEIRQEVLDSVQGSKKDG